MSKLSDQTQNETDHLKKSSDFAIFALKKYIADLLNQMKISNCSGKPEASSEINQSQDFLCQMFTCLWLRNCVWTRISHTWIQWKFYVGFQTWLQTRAIKSMISCPQNIFLSLHTLPLIYFFPGEQKTKTSAEILERIKQHQEFLLDELEPKQIAKQMIKKEVLTEDDCKEIVSSKLPRRDRVKKLLNLIEASEQTTEGAVQMFMAVLEDCGLSHVIEELVPNVSHSHAGITRSTQYN